MLTTTRAMARGVRRHRPVMTRLLAATATAVTVTALGSGCAGPSVDASCDVDGVTHDVEHMVEEAGLTADTLDSLECSGDWAVATVTVSSPDSDPIQETFIFQQADAGWILKAPEVACDDAPGLAAIPDDLRAGVCSEQ